MKERMGEPERELIRRAKRGDEEAFTRLLDPLLRPACLLAFGILHRHSDAEDAVQDASLIAWRRLHNLRDGAELRPWFLAVVVNRCRSMLRARWWNVLRLELTMQARAEESESEVALDLERALRALSYEQRVAILARYYLDLPNDEVAAILGLSVAGAKSRIHRGLVHLRRLMDFREATI